MNPVCKVPAEANVPSLAVWRHDRSNKRVQIGCLDFRLLLLPHSTLQPLSEIIKQEQKHQVPRDHSRMDIRGCEMEFDLILLRRRLRELFVRPTHTNEGREDVATYAQPESDTSAHGPTKNNYLGSTSIEQTTRARRYDRSVSLCRFCPPPTV